MKPVRLLPVVIFAALALLLFKGIGLLTNGSYVLTGTSVAIAQEHAAAPAGEAPAVAADAPTASEATMTDSNPVLGDSAPTMPTKTSAPTGEPAATAGEHASAPGEVAAVPAAGATGASADAPAGAAPPSEHGAAPVATACPDTTAGAAGAAPANLTDNIGSALVKGCPADAGPVDAHGDAIPATMNGNGEVVPLATAEGDNSKEVLLQRLSTRSAELDKRQAELDMRDALLTAAQKKLDDQTKAIQDLQTQVTAMVDQKAAAEGENFKGIVAMYEAMKPADAAKIFDTLNLDVLLKISQAMSPRKMSPVLALMKPQAAEALTTAFATSVAPPMPVASGENLAALPQIVGK